MRPPGLVPVALACLVVVALAGVAHTYEVIDAGSWVEDVNQRVYKVRLLGGIDLYVPDRLTLDTRSGNVLAAEIASGFALALLAGVGLLAAAIARARGQTGPRSLHRLGLALSAGAGLLAMDELLETSELIEYSLGLPSTPILTELDATAYAIGGLVFVLRFRHLFGRSERGRPWIFAGVGGLILGGLFDLTDLAPAVEEMIEACSLIALLAGFTLLFADLAAEPAAGRAA